MVKQAQEPGPVFDFEGVFGDHYIYFYGPDLTPERNAHEAGLIWRLLSLQPGDSVLDLGCGHGRISIELAKRGANVTGLDASAMFLDLARQAAEASGVSVDLVEGDMRDLPWKEAFDAVFIWYTTFGYFDEAGNEEVLRQALKALRPGGRLLIDQTHRTALLRRGLPRTEVFQRGDDLMIDLLEYDISSERSQTERVVVKDGRIQRARFSVRLYSYVELERMLRMVGFRSVEGFGREGEPLTLYSQRLLVRAGK